MDNSTLRPMKHRFSARDTALVLIPTLALGAFALYSQRTENVGPRGLYVESSELVPATPLDVSHGYSHYLTVTLNFGGPKPSWWAKDGAYRELMAATPSTFRWTNQFGREFPQRHHAFAVGEELSVKRGGKSVVLPQAVGVMSYPSVEEKRYVFKHYVALPKVPIPAGEVTFRSVYALRELQPFYWQKVVRDVGEITPPVDRKPHATILEWKTIPSPSDPSMELDVKVKHSPKGDRSPGQVSWEDLEIVDSRRQVFRHGPDFNIGLRYNLSEMAIPLCDLGPSFIAS